jgi:diaminohydroxyphosphoribosylaminopyrimidine deaminase/5-amino-6-(5-phosphoribosylamino)uracil reductase
MMCVMGEKFMKLALRLAGRGIGRVEPNPAVGCVIVKDGRIVGRGWHKKFGGPHAEITALEDFRSSGSDPAEAVMYVSLEPCCHQGKTGACTDAIISAGLAKVVVAAVDPSPHASGKGIRQLRDAGIEVETGVCEEEAKLLNAAFMKFASTGRCWVVLKWAQTIDGKLAYSDKTKGQWISNEKSRKDAHKLRRRVQAILVGVNTVIVDDPLLTARPGRGRAAARIVLDGELRLPLDCKLLSTAKKAPVIVVTSQRAIRTNREAAEKIAAKGAEVFAVATKEGRCDIGFLLDELSKRGIAQLLVEGGPTVITSFLKQRLGDEICVYIAPKILGGCGEADVSQSMVELTAGAGLHYVDIKRFGDDVRITGLTCL